MTEGIAAADAAVMASARPRGMFGPHRRRARSLLAGSAFAGGVLAALMANPQRASAACTVDPGVPGTTAGTITCGGTTTTDTTNTVTKHTDSNDRNQLFNNGADVVGSVADNLTAILGSGLQISQGNAAARLDMTNNGTVSITASTAERGVLQLIGAGGAIIYNGSGSAISHVSTEDHDGLNISNIGNGVVTVGRTGSVAIPITGTFTGSGTGSGIAITTDAGLQNVAIGAAAITGDGGLVMSSGNGNQVLSMDGATVTATDAAGISLTATGGSINATVANTTIVNSSGAVNATIGINVVTGNGNITVTSSASIGGDSTAPLFDTDIRAISNGAGNVTVTSNRAISAAGVAIAARSATGNVTVAGSGAVTGGSSGDGISAHSTAGNVLVAQTNTVSGGTGINALARGAGTVTVQATNSVTGTDPGLFGIGTVSSNGNTLVNVTNVGTVITGAGTGIDSTIEGAGSLAINVAQGTTVTSTSSSGIIIGQTGAGIGTYAVDNSGTITGAGSANNPVINVATTTGSTNITNRTGGTIQSVAGLADDVVVGSTGGPIAIANAGTLTGRVTLTGTGAKSIVNNAGGVWSTLGRSDFTGGSSTIDNAGTIVVAGVATFNQLTTLTNSGAINLTSASGTLNVSGNLVLTPGSSFGVQLSPTGAAQAVVAGTATLAGRVQASFSPGSYVSKNYTILTAGSRSGRFDSLVTNLLPAGFTAALDYSTPNAVALDLTATLGQGSGSGPGSGLQAIALNNNQRNVANALNNGFNTGGVLPASFLPVFGLAGGNLGTALSQLSGEAATGARHGAFEMMTGFLGVMTDPLVDGRDGRGGDAVHGGAMGFAPERTDVPADVALAYAKATKAQVSSPAPAFEQRWSVWGSGFGGSNRTGGDPVVVGSHDVSARATGFAAGADYRVAPDTVVGLALGGGGTNWALAQGLGGGNSDAFQAGVYGATRSGPAYVTAALAFANHWMSTDRVAFAGDHLGASFNAQSYGGRVETGYRAATPLGAVTPYAAVQAQSFRTPSFGETDLNGGGFALAYSARTATDTRSELGSRFDRTVPTEVGATLNLRGKLAWAHDWVSEPTLGAVFQTLPGASFTVSGAAPAHESGLVSAGAELRFVGGTSLGAKFDGEFAARSQIYTGVVTARYGW
jgi:uncharacterized protein with beta-barrel porin domain